MTSQVIRDKATVQAELDACSGNAVVYSDLAWSAARKASDGSNRWFADCGSWSGSPMNSGEMVSWVSDWIVLRSVSDPQRWNGE